MTYYTETATLPSPGASTYKYSGSSTGIHSSYPTVTASGLSGSMPPSPATTVTGILSAMGNSRVIFLGATPIKGVLVSLLETKWTFMDGSLLTLGLDVKDENPSTWEWYYLDEDTQKSIALEGKGSPDWKLIEAMKFGPKGMNEDSGVFVPKYPPLYLSAPTVSPPGGSTTPYLPPPGKIPTPPSYVPYASPAPYSYPGSGGLASSTETSTAGGFYHPPHLKHGSAAYPPIPPRPKPSPRTKHLKSPDPQTSSNKRSFSELLRECKPW